ncbi:hypothetical protein GCM10007147_41600 [Nocardiopsis kunsanensis]|uniref:OmpR/PhoB-type domain-containing protein n=1 Tax=Nocardiopsis kunsanensis TaxID=141693 RepID=A0A919CKX1_9ACTN|nr:BTAD domain-containing putative transcriptional regulator [Nocardiopsis kunsanensis]GHD35273.1 hypothetical protein GCM10007147_41600 [Nocardiopsis kunsanensis]
MERKVWFQVLGPFRFIVDGADRTPTQPRLRIVLTLLVLRRDEVVSTDQLIDELWDDEPPMTARTALQVYISNLRKLFKHVLGPERGEALLVSHGNGYRLTARPGEVDAEVFDEHVSEGCRTAAEGDQQGARRHFERGLGLWEGECLEGAPSSALRRSHAVQLQEKREQVLEERIRLDLAQGLHTQVIPELQALTVQYPTREGLAQLLMISLHQAGRRADALEVYHRTRTSLVELLGVDPSTALTEFYTELLDADCPPQPALPVATDTGPATAPPPGRGEVPGPAQLPRKGAELRGRCAEVTHMVERLRASLGVRAEVCLLTGEPGVGKTEVALHVAHEVRDLFPDGQLHVDAMEGRGRSDGPRALARKVLRSLGAGHVDDEGDLDRLAGAVRSALSERRVLLVIENVENEEQIRPLLPGYEGCAAIITGRSSLLGIAGSTRLRLRPLRPSAGVEYFTELWTGEPAREKAVRELVDYCDGLPLALRICALRGRERFTRVEDVLQELRSSTSPLSRLRAGDLDVRECLEWTLERCDIEQRLLLTQIAELDQDTFRFDDLLRAVPDGVNRVEAASALASLVEISALDRAEVDGGDGYRMRNLVRQYLLDGDRTGRDAESVAGT